ncbi:D-beta-hydroxybutyrate dehydrogenase, mitochondrial, partial [Tetrabaena socialis]
QVFAGVRREVDGEALVRLAPSIVPVLLDVTSCASTAAAVAVVASKLEGRNLSGLVNNAGKGVFMPLELMPMEVFDDVMAVNVSGLVRVTKAAIPLLR